MFPDGGSTPPASTNQKFHKINKLSSKGNPKNGHYAQNCAYFGLSFSFVPSSYWYIFLLTQ